MAPDSVKIPKDSLDKLIRASQKLAQTEQGFALEWTSVWTILLTIIISGSLGGFVNYYYSDHNNSASDKKLTLRNAVFIGAGAAVLVPVFLAITQSNILDGLLKNQVRDYILFISFCVLAGITSSRFISSVSDSVIDRLKKNEEAIKTVEKEAENAKDKADKVESQTDVMIKAAEERSGKSKTAELLFMTENIELPNLEGGDSNDPMKGKFGGQRAAGGFVISVDKKQVESINGWYELIFQVKAQDPSSTPLKGEVVFFLHPTFKPDIERVTAVNGVAQLTKIAWGAFTIGAIVNDTGTRLELDLEDEPDLPNDFKSR